MPSVQPWLCPVPGATVIGIVCGAFKKWTIEFDDLSLLGKSYTIAVLNASS
jgi:hypothetical protein